MKGEAGKLANIRGKRMSHDKLVHYVACGVTSASACSDTEQVVTKLLQENITLIGNISID